MDLLFGYRENASKKLKENEIMEEVSELLKFHIMDLTMQEMALYLVTKQMVEFTLSAL